MSLHKTIYLLKNKLGSVGGLEKYTWRIAHAFLNKNCQVNIVTSDAVNNGKEHPLLNFITLPSEKGLSVAKIKGFDKAVKKFLSSHHYDVAFGLDKTSFQTHIRLGNGVHRKFLQTRKFTDPFWKRMVIPFNPLHRTILSMEKKALESPQLKCIFTNSHMVKNEVLECYKVDPKKIHVVHNGVEWYEMEKDFETYLEKKTKIATTLQLDPTQYQFLFVGNGFARKGLDVLLKALSLIKKESFHLSVIGKDKHAFSYIQKAKELGIGSKVSFYGQLSEIRKFYQLCDCLVIPSFYDPFANVTVEALAMGLHVISSKSNGGHEILSNGRILETLTDPECLKEALLEALSIPKTWIHATQVRNSVKHLDFSHQTGSLVEIALTNL